jgi:hypothetical protein
MTSLTRLLGAAAAASAVAAPAAAQYYPYPNQPGYNYPAYPGQAYPPQYPPQYPQTYPGYGYQQPYGYNNGTVGDIIDQLLGNRYNVTDRQAVRRCASAATAQAAAQYSGGYGGYGYNQEYRGNANARVTAITDVQRRSDGLRVSGLMSSGSYGGYGNQYEYGNRGQLSFRCKVDYRGAVTNVRVRPAGGY